MHGHLWAPIEDIPQSLLSGENNSQLSSMMEAWHEQKAELKASPAWQTFISRLQHQWAIETGIIENLYSLSLGATATMIAHGLDANLISSDDTLGEDPRKVVVTIQDQLEALRGLYTFVSGERPLGTSYLKELHQALTRNQSHFHGIDQLGNPCERELHHGAWKSWPNHVRLPDGSEFQYCPPEHVDSEIDNLLEWHRKHVADNVAPEISAAWIHHRFTLIHPFEDGNGRVARCLATLIFLKADWLPLVITRDDKPDYISALRAADDGDLSDLVRFFGELQRRKVREALQIGTDVLEASASVDQILEAMAPRLKERQETQQRLLERSREFLQNLSRGIVERTQAFADQLQQKLSGFGATFQVFADHGANETEKSGYHRLQVVAAAKEFRYYANLEAYHSWAKIIIQSPERHEILVSLHREGKGPGGLFACTVIFYAKVEDPEDGHTQIEGLKVFGTEPFEISYKGDFTTVNRHFMNWLDQRLLDALAHWQSVA